MILYHGTIKGYADQIQRDGLRAHPENAFHVNSIPVGHGIYLTTSHDWAKEFARYRSAYSRMKPGETDWVNGIGKRLDGQGPVADVDVTPVVVKFNVPAGAVEKLVPDADTHMFSSPNPNRVCDCEIPAEYVAGVEEVYEQEGLG